MQAILEGTRELGGDPPCGSECVCKLPLERGRGCGRIHDHLHRQGDIHNVNNSVKREESLSNRLGSLRVGVPLVVVAVGSCLCRLPFAKSAYRDEKPGR